MLNESTMKLNMIQRKKAREGLHTLSSPEKIL